VGVLGAETKIRVLARELKALEVTKLSNHDVVELMQLRHTNCYKDGRWGALEWKWARKAQQIIAGFLDLLCGG
jgi:hypothetical protein